MRNNKILGCAITTALSMGVAGQAYAGTATITGPTGAVPASGAAAISLAAENYANNGDWSPGNGASFPTLTTEYDFTHPTGSTNIEDEIYLTYTLTGAEWDPQPSASNASWNGTTCATIALAAVDDNSVTFLVQPPGPASAGNIVVGTDKFAFNFTLGNAPNLATESGQVGLEVAWGAATSGPPSEQVLDTGSLTLFTSKLATQATFTDRSTDTVEIDVAEGSKQFIGSSYGTTRAAIGTLALYDNSPTPKQADTGGTDFINYTLASGYVSGGTLQIQKGSFAASRGTNQVFIQTAGTDCEYTEGDLVADTVTDTEATWNLTEEELIIGNTTSPIVGALYSSSRTDRNICIEVDGSTQINETGERPTATLTINYSNGRTLEKTDRLKQLERNGVVCTLYNVPNNGATDVGFYRFTNKTEKPAILLGTLRDRDAKYYLEDVDLLNGGTVPAYGTSVISSDQIVALVEAEGNTADWKARAVMTVTTDVTDMEMIAMLRGKALANPPVVADNEKVPPFATFGPLVNMSQGATKACK